MALAASSIAATPLQAAAAQGPTSHEAQARATIDAAIRLAHWQVERLDNTSHVSQATSETANTRGWERAVFWIGMTALADHGGGPDIREDVLKMGTANGWTPGSRPYHADDLAITQSYLWAAGHGAGAPAIAPTRKGFDFILAHPARVSLAFYQGAKGGDVECLERWCWCDALFMAPPAMIELSRQTGDPRYAAFALKEFWATTDFLFDPAQHLYYRDSRFFERRDEQQRKLFWSRGNGWVFASMARIIPLLPKGSADDIRMRKLFVEMAGRLKELQKPDGYWAPSLLAPEQAPPETSGTAFFTYGMAWGISAGLLGKESYAPVAQKGWQALAQAIQPDGRLGWVQQVSDRPDKVEASDTQYYGVGAFLLAATEVSKLQRSGILN
ncbi:glycoside hydrolase family 88/105 protein [Novosphingobium terrae]|uniref:glycoside hydrolase family 88/105 protein n=1 Tax=Novosphingobium terrae TaxID=2726189 RepID=UPI00197D4482